MIAVKDRAKTVEKMSAEGASLSDMSQVLGISARSVSRYKRKLELAAPALPPLPPESIQRIQTLRSEGMPSNWVAEDIGCHPRSVSARARLSSEDKMAWRSVWLMIRKDPALLALHREFSPPTTRGWTAAHG